MSKELCVLEFDSVDEAFNFAKEINPKSTIYTEMYNESPDGAWLFVLGLCDICNAKQIFFIPSCAFENGIKGSECSECGNMSVYPKEGSFEDA